MPFAQTRLVGSQYRGKVCKSWLRAVQGLVDEHLFGGVGQMVIPTDNVRDLHLRIVDDNGVVVGRAAVRPQQDRIADDLTRETDLPVYDVVKSDGTFPNPQTENGGFSLLDPGPHFILGKAITGSGILP